MPKGDTIEALMSMGKPGEVLTDARMKLSKLWIKATSRLGRRTLKRLFPVMTQLPTNSLWQSVMILLQLVGIQVQVYY